MVKILIEETNIKKDKTAKDLEGLPNGETIRLYRKNKKAAAVVTKAAAMKKLTSLKIIFYQPDIIVTFNINTFFNHYNIKEYFLI
jgi:predicted CoA-binding protein